LTTYPLLVPVIALSTTALGVLGLVWARTDLRPVQMTRGCRLFALTLATVGGLILAAALVMHQSILAFGLVFAALFIAMLWGGAEEALTGGRQ
jgi:hypothetical protein